jgi:hypothetical protein
LVAEFEASGLNRREFCRTQGVSVWTLSRYVQQRRSAQADGVGASLMAVEVRGARPGKESGRDSGLALALSTGRRIEVDRGFDAATLVQLLGLLERV